MEEKNIKKDNDKFTKELTDAGKIKGKIDIHDTRERKDGPGGN